MMPKIIIQIKDSKDAIFAFSGITLGSVDPYLQYNIKRVETG